MRVAGAQDLFSAVIQTPKNKIAWLTTFHRNVSPLYSRLRDITDFIPFFISIFHDSKRERHANYVFPFLVLDRRTNDRHLVFSDRMCNYRISPFILNYPLYRIFVAFIEQTSRHESICGKRVTNIYHRW